jgi:hypothetical protein
VSYHGEDLAAVERFIARFGKHNFIKRAITLPREVIDSNDTEYVMRRIRQLYLRDSTVTIVLIGKSRGHAATLIGSCKHRYGVR